MKVMKPASAFVLVLMVSRAVFSASVADDEEEDKNKTKLSVLDGLIKSGASLGLYTIHMLMETSVSVSVGIVIENFTRWPMTSPQVYHDSGHVNKYPPAIAPLTREGMAAHKAELTATGTSGSASWLLNNERLILMWSVPFSQDFHSNELGVGTKATHTSEDTKQMLETEKYWFRKKKYYYNAPVLFFENGRILVLAKMDRSHTPVVVVKVYPGRYENLPQEARNVIEKRDYVISI